MAGSDSGFKYDGAPVRTMATKGAQPVNEDELMSYIISHLKACQYNDVLDILDANEVGQACILNQLVLTCIP